MKMLLFILLIFATPFVIAQRLKQEDLNVYVTRRSSLFASHVSSFDQVDFRNSRAVHISPDGHKGEWQALKRGKGKTEYISRYGGFEGATDVVLAWQQALDAAHWLVAYDWEWVGGSSSHSQVVQVFELRDGKIFITQQIEADTHHGGRAVGAILNEVKKTLVVRAVEIDSPKGRCCPTHINVVVFTWTGKTFHRVSARQIPNPGYEQ